MTKDFDKEFTKKISEKFNEEAKKNFNEEFNKEFNENFNKKFNKEINKRFGSDINEELNKKVNKKINEDINNYYKEVETDSFDVITCNPPFFKYIETSNINKNDYKTIARHEVKLNLRELFIIAKKLLKNNGVIAIVHRPERFVEVVEEMKKNNIEPKRVQFVYPKKNMEANIMLIEGSKNGKPGLKILPPIYSHQDNGEYTDDVKKYFE